MNNSSHQPKQQPDPQPKQQPNTPQHRKRPTAWFWAVATAAGLGVFAGYNMQSGSQATVAAPVTTATNTAPSMTPALYANSVNAKKRSYNEQKARTASESNTIDVVKASQNGLVFIEVTERNTDNPAARLRQQLRERFPFPFNFDLPEEDGEGGDEQDGNRSRQGSGSGFFIDKQGHIITNNHVVEDADEITVKLFGDKTKYKAKVISRAQDYDLALIRVEGLKASQIQPLPLGDSDQLEVGLKAIAMGAPFGLEFSVSEGIVSSVARNVPIGTRNVRQKVIQTDAAINPGNSGGPLLNSSGEVIGVNTQILTGGISQSAGVGFSVPVNVVKRLLPQMQAGKGDVKTPTLGIQFTDLSYLKPDERSKSKLPDKGALLQKVFPNSPAARAGLKGGNNLALPLSKDSEDAISTNGDIIVGIDGHEIEDGEDLRRAVIGKTIGDTIKLSVLRNKKKREFTIRLEPFDFPKSNN